jgi:hypothetical protein
MAGNNEDHGRSRRPSTEDRGWSHRLGIRWPDDREVRWRCVWSAPCTWRWGARVSWLSLKTKIDSLSVIWRQNHWDGYLRFGLKIGGDGFLRFRPQSRWWRFLSVWPQNRWLEFSGLSLKIDSYGLMIWASKSPWWFFCFEPQNQVGDGLSVAP